MYSQTCYNRTAYNIPDMSNYTTIMSNLKSLSSIDSKKLDAKFDIFVDKQSLFKTNPVEGSLSKTQKFVNLKNSFAAEHEISQQFQNNDLPKKYVK